MNVHAFSPHPAGFAGDPPPRGEGGDCADPYRAFLEAKAAVAQVAGFEVPLDAINPALKPHVRVGVQWALAGGRRALFWKFGLHKTSAQLEIARIVLRQVRERHGRPGRFLIVLPLGVRQEFFEEARARFSAECAIKLKFIRSIAEAEPDTCHLTNYETVRDGKLDPREFDGASLDEAAILRGFGGTKTFREFMRLFDGMAFKFVATATPSPNEYIEILAYAAFLEIMDVGQAKTRFFKRNSEAAGDLDILPHKEEEFWLWVASWALFIAKPSDLGFSDEGYELPPVAIHWHEVQSDHAGAGEDRDGQMRLIRNSAAGVVDAAREKRDSLAARIAKMMELRALDPRAHRLIWHDLEAEREAIEKAAPNIVTVYGAQELERRERHVADFSAGRLAELAAKPVMCGSGCNFQRHCAWAIFLGIGFKFNDFIQAVHRIVRFLQTREVRIDLIYSEAERDIRRALEQKWARHDAMVERMSCMIRDYGLTQASLAHGLKRSIGVTRAEVVGEGYRLINNDCVEECARMPAASVDLIVTSIPFATQYEYTPSYNDFGHTDDNAHFWRQMGFLVPELLRVLKPGRIAAIHVKDRIVPGGLNGLGFQTVNPFSDETVAEFRRHGFALIARKTIVTDVVRENNQTYRLGWTEQCKDGTKMGAGLPEYVLLFRKPPSDTSDGYADAPVVKAKPLCADNGAPAPFDKKRNWKTPVPGTGYSRALWQFDAHGFTRSSGNRLLSSAEVAGLPHKQLFRLWRDRSTHAVYDFAGHLAVAEEMDELQRLPSTFMLLPPHSWHPDVWSDVTRMRTLNGVQHAKGKELHLCPLQFDIVDRLILQFSQEGETVLDPFGGLMTVPYCALQLRRRGIGIELSTGHFLDGVQHCEAAARKMATATLFDLMSIEAEDEAETAA